MLGSSFVTYAAATFATSASEQTSVRIVSAKRNPMTDTIDKQNERRVNLTQVAYHLAFATEILEHMLKQEGGDEQ